MRNVIIGYFYNYNYNKKTITNVNFILTPTVAFLLKTFKLQLKQILLQ